MGSIAATRTRLQRLEWRKLIGIVLAILATSTAALAYYGYAYAARSEPVVVAAVDVAPGVRLTPDVLEVVYLPVTRPATLRGLADTTLAAGQYTRVQLSPGAIVQPQHVQPTPLDDHIFVNGDLPFEKLHGTVFELSLSGISTVNTQDRVNILVLVDALRGVDSTFSLGALDAPGSGPRAVRVLADLNVLQVREGVALIEVTPAQSQYLWALSSATVPFVGEVSRDTAPLGVLRTSDATLPLLAAPAADPTPQATP